MKQDNKNKYFKKAQFSNNIIFLTNKMDIIKVTLIFNSLKTNLKIIW